LDVLDDGGDCVLVVAEESADEWGCGVVDGDNAERVAVEQATIDEIHCDRQIDERLMSCDVRDSQSKGQGKPSPEVASVGAILHFKVRQG
jgi:hypothetical protein